MPRVNTKSTVFSVSLPHVVAEEVILLAEIQRRTVSNTLALIVQDFLEGKK